MAGTERLERSTRGFGGNVEISLALRLLPDFGDLLPAAPLMLQELMLFWWYAKFCARLLMLLMMKFDSTVLIVVGIEDRSGEQDGRWAMLKICVALIKEKGIASLTKSVRYLESATRLNCCRYYKSHAGLCQDVGKAQYLRRIKQRKGIIPLRIIQTSITSSWNSIYSFDIILSKLNLTMRQLNDILYL